jgi:Fic family protein
MRYRLQDFFPKGYYLTYKEAQKIIDDTSFFTTKMKERMKRLLYYKSQCKNLNISFERLKYEFKLTIKQLNKVLKNFEKINLNPVTLKNSSNVLQQDSILGILGLDLVVHRT